ncbi:unnamed protein product [Aphanomyces euteiches]|nr:hypothetical protein Ae201684P_006085 [Aphanomyces euteiches]
MDRTRKGIRRRHDPDDDEIRLEMPPNKKALVELLENLCISMSTKDPVTIDEREENDAAAKFISSNGPRQYVYPRRNRYNLYTAYMRRMRDAPTASPRDPSMGTMVLYNASPRVPSPLRSFMFPPFTIPEEDEGDGSAYDTDMMMDVDMDCEEYYTPPCQPRLAGSLTHSEWFLPDDPEDDGMDIMDIL